MMGTKVLCFPLRRLRGSRAGVLADQGERSSACRAEGISRAPDPAAQPPKADREEELLNAVWGDASVTENSLSRSIALLRRLLGDETRNPRYIETVATVGYRFVCKVEVAEDGAGNLQATGGAKGLAEGDLIETPANGEIAEATANRSEQINKVAWDKERSAQQTDERRFTPRK